jgi:indolepyruvate ferredoxin oxidoreductase alpha subunit
MTASKSNKIKPIFQDSPGERILAMGNQAIARGAIEAGVQLATGYPGTPSTEIMETLIAASTHFGFQAFWGVNEKVAFDAATGASFAGARSLVAVKHVGVNVLSDSLMQINHIDIAGGLVLVAVDDVGGMSSNNEQDSRFYAAFAEIPCLEPATLDEARLMVKAAFDISENMGVPVMVRSVNRLSHLTASLTLGEINAVKKDPKFDNSRAWVGFPSLEPHRKLREKIKHAGQVLMPYEFNKLDHRPESKLAIIAGGFTVNYVAEALKMLGLEEQVTVLGIRTPNPLPLEMIKKIIEQVDTIVVVEDVNWYLESAVLASMAQSARQAKVIGRLSGDLPPVGETTVDNLIQLLEKLVPESAARPVFSEKLADISQEIRVKLPRRGINFCAGCPHRGSYYSLSKAIKSLGLEEKMAVIGDIGCYTLGIWEPFSLLKSMTSMGASMGTAAIAQLSPDQKTLAVIGDSTLFHAGQPGLLQIALNQAPVTVVVTDNRVTAMTGAQADASTGLDLRGGTDHSVKIEDLARAYGFKHIFVGDAYNIPQMFTLFRKALAIDAPTMVIARRECALAEQTAPMIQTKAKVKANKCTGCMECIDNFGCPALQVRDSKSTTSGNKVFVDINACVGCGECRFACPDNAITLDFSALAKSINENRRHIIPAAFKTLKKNYWKIKPAWSFKKKLRTVL